MGVTIGKAARIIGVHPSTLKRWIRTGKIPRPNLNRNGWNIFDPADIEQAQKYAHQIIPSPDKAQIAFLK